MLSRTNGRRGPMPSPPARALDGVQELQQAVQRGDEPGQVTEQPTERSSTEETAEQLPEQTERRVGADDEMHRVEMHQQTRKVEIERSERQVQNVARRG